MSAVLSAPNPSPSPWRVPLLVLGAVLLLLLWQYRSTFMAMVGIWERSDTFAHAFLVPPISLWLVWRQRDRLRSMTPQGHPWMLLPVSACALVWLVGEIAGVNAITQLAVTALLVLAPPALLGWPIARAMAFPLCFLFFMVPIGDFVMPQMMDWTADVTVFVLRVFGVPVFREGLQFIIPTGSWSVVEACSGVRYLIASFMVGTLFAYLNYNSTRRRLAFVLVSLVVPIVANWARAVIIVTLGHLSRNKLAVGVDHLIYGWVFFGVVIGIMFFIGAKWSEDPIDEASTGISGAHGVVQPSVSLQWLTAAAMALVLSAAPMLAVHLQSAEIKTPALRLPDLPGLVAADDATPLTQPKFEGPRAEAVRVYGQGEQAVTVHVAYYRQQTYGHKLVNSQNVLVTSDDLIWRQAERSSVALRVGGQDISFRTALLRRGELGDVKPGSILLVRQVFWVNGRLTSNDHLAALLGVAGQLSGRGDDAAALTFYMAAGEDIVASSRALDAMVASHTGRLTGWLDTVRADQ